MVTLETGKSAILEMTRKALSLEVWRLTFSCEKMPIHCAVFGYSYALITFRIPTVVKKTKVQLRKNRVRSDEENGYRR